MSEKNKNKDKKQNNKTNNLGNSGPMAPPPVGLFASLKGFINTFVRLLPIGFYAGTIMSGFVFGDSRGTWLFLGLIINEMISYGYRMILSGIYNPQCALMKNGEDYFVLPSPITQTIGFIFGFYMTHMFFQEGPNAGFKAKSFFGFTILLVVTIFSRINVGCKGFLEAVYCALVGILLGVGYYNIIKEYYPLDREKVKKTKEEPDVLDSGDFFDY